MSQAPGLVPHPASTFIHWQFPYSRAHKAQKIALAKWAALCYDYPAFVALVKPLDSFKGAASPNL
jgi:hypothetical protein